MNNKLKNKFKKYYPLILSPLLVLAVLLYVFSIYNMYPFGKGSIAWCDMNQQTIPLLMAFKDILDGKDSIFLNMKNAGGMNFFGVFCFFLSNPFSLLAAFTEKENMIFFANIIVILKLTLCGFTSALYFSICKEKISGIISVSFGMMYSLCGYGMLFYQNIMWLDIMYMFPVLMVGLEKLTAEKKNLVYIISLSAIMIMNFYIGYMISVFILLYMSLYMIFSHKENYSSEVMVKFFFGTAISALITAVIWLPSFIQVYSSGRMKSLYDTLSGSNFLTSYLTVLPLLFCTAFIFPIIVFYTINNKNRTYEQKNNLMLFALMLIPFFIEPVNLMWHTGSYMSFPSRYGFITVFIGLICCADFFEDNNEFEIKKSKQFIALPVLLFVILWYCGYSESYIEKNFKTLTKYTSSLWGDKSSFDGLAKLFVITGICYMIIYIFYRKKIIARQVFSVLLLSLCIFECAGNIKIYMVSPSLNNPLRTETFENISKLSDKINDKDFYRVITDYSTADYNMTGAVGYNSISHYTSLTDHDFMYMQRLLGYSTVWMKSGSSGGTELTNSLYSVKYKITNTQKTENSVYSTDKFSIEKMPYYNGIGLICENDFSDCENIPSNLTRAEIQQYIFSEIYGTDKKLINEYSYDKKQSSKIQYSNEKYNIQNGALIKYNFYVKGKQSIYFDCFDGFSNDLSEEYFESLTVKVNNKIIKSQYPQADSNGFLKIGEFENENITVEINAVKKISCYSFGVFGLCLDILSDAIKNSDCGFFNYENGKIIGNVNTNTDKNKTCFLAVPYNEGMIVKINGKIIPCRKALSDFTVFSLEKGKNEIEIILIPKGFIIGMIITVIGLIILTLYIIFGKKAKPNKKAIKILEMLTGFSVIFGVLIVYVFPMFISFS